ncbi:hypothetical protein DFH27DRAFT_546341 [Peziza echinospora]|nr:hypothetical protein DFH27DRAFT_546341 [Peziza echinospora]
MPFRERLRSLVKGEPYVSPKTMHEANEQVSRNGRAVDVANRSTASRAPAENLRYGGQDNVSAETSRQKDGSTLRQADNAGRMPATSTADTNGLREGRALKETLRDTRPDGFYRGHGESVKDQNFGRFGSGGGVSGGKVKGRQQPQPGLKAMRTTARGSHPQTEDSLAAAAARAAAYPRGERRATGDFAPQENPELPKTIPTKIKGVDHELVVTEDGVVQDQRAMEESLMIAMVVEEFEWTSVSGGICQQKELADQSFRTTDAGDTLQNVRYIEDVGQQEQLHEPEPTRLGGTGHKVSYTEVVDEQEQPIDRSFRGTDPGDTEQNIQDQQQFHEPEEPHELDSEQKDTMDTEQKVSDAEDYNLQDLQEFYEPKATPTPGEGAEQNLKVTKDFKDGVTQDQPEIFESETDHLKVTRDGVKRDEQAMQESINTAMENTDRRAIDQESVTKTPVDQTMGYDRRGRPSASSPISRFHQEGRRRSEDYIPQYAYPEARSFRTKRHSSANAARIPMGQKESKFPIEDVVSSAQVDDDESNDLFINYRKNGYGNLSKDSEQVEDTTSQSSSNRSLYLSGQISPRTKVYDENYPRDDEEKYYDPPDIADDAAYKYAPVPESDVSICEHECTCTFLSNHPPRHKSVELGGESRVILNSAVQGLTSDPPRPNLRVPVMGVEEEGGYYENSPERAGVYFYSHTESA